MHLARAPSRELRTWAYDSRRWAEYAPRESDIVIATYPKCGTTWMQRIVSLLIFQSTEAIPLTTISPWVERRFPDSIESVVDTLEKQAHRRAVKTHLPLDGIPLFDEAKYIHVARDGRDACLSYHNHIHSFSAATLAKLDQVGFGRGSASPIRARPTIRRRSSVNGYRAVRCRGRRTAFPMSPISISRTRIGASGSARMC